MTKSPQPALNTTPAQDPDTNEYVKTLCIAVDPLDDEPTEPTLRLLDEPYKEIPKVKRQEAWYRDGFAPREEIPWDYQKIVPGEFVRSGSRLPDDVSTLADLHGGPGIQLTDLEREILKLRLAGTRLAVIAAQLSCSIGQVKKISARWREELRALIGADGSGRVCQQYGWYQRHEIEAMALPSFRRLTAAGLVEVNRRLEAGEPLWAEGLEWTEAPAQRPHPWPRSDRVIAQAKRAASKRHPRVLH